MCFFKKKKKEQINSLYKIGEFVGFKDRHGDLTMGTIYNVYKDENGNTLYDVQIGGECPIVINRIKEEGIILRK